MQAIRSHYDRLTRFLFGSVGEGIALLLARVALAGIFWRSDKAKVVEGTWLEINDIQYDIFANEFSGLPIPTDIAVPMATYAEFIFPILLVIGLATRFSALALGIMALVIQLFVFPTSAHFFGWAITVLALAAVLISRGAGVFSLDAIVSRITAK